MHSSRIRSAKKLELALATAPTLQHLVSVNNTTVYAAVLMCSLWWNIVNLTAPQGRPIVRARVAGQWHFYCFGGTRYSIIAHRMFVACGITTRTLISRYARSVRRWPDETRFAHAFVCGHILTWQIRIHQAVTCVLTRGSVSFVDSVGGTIRNVWNHASTQLVGQ